MQAPLIVPLRFFLATMSRLQCFGVRSFHYWFDALALFRRLLRFNRRYATGMIFHQRAYRALKRPATIKARSASGPVA